ncbi:uracil-DNA glycosylase [Devosia pacifica]|uniref:Type-4 uracil-DNA glycosylase n=1 Tax=Devosia pacifica TaxID=1335967 RepID=A0A918S8K5_9HYPH|nr:uracil-DNA glycosylase [Devosia pacifica]GHA30412.1 uracil-DNA glycosylase [Devosia pacifica]
MPANQTLNRDQLLSVLEWYSAAGVDTAIGEEPVDRFAQQRQAVEAALKPRQRAESAPAATPPVPASDPSMSSDPAEARALAKDCATLEALEATLEAYDGCGLKRRATQLVFADGNPNAEIMLIGEAPGAEEDRQGKPFVGRSGQLLDRMLAAIGLDRSSVYICNTVPWRPPGNRTPTPEEMALCLPFINRQVELVAPRLIVTLGGPAMKTVFDTSEGILKRRGHWANITVGSHQAEAMPTLHPAYLLRTPGAKHQAWRDMLSLKAKMRELGMKAPHD